MKLFAFSFKGYDSLDGWRVGVDFGPRKFGLEVSTVVGKVTRTPYLGRIILYGGWGTIRLHKFYRGDNDRAPHTHPWGFWTMPLASYTERRFLHGVDLGIFTVKAFRWHYRPATHEHIVIGRVRRAHHGSRLCVCMEPDPRPFYTIVIGGNKSNEWGFYPEPGKFVHHREFLDVDQ